MTEAHEENNGQANSTKEPTVPNSIPLTFEDALKLYFGSDNTKPGKESEAVLALRGAHRQALSALEALQQSWDSTGEFEQVVDSYAAHLPGFEMYQSAKAAILAAHATAVDRAKREAVRGAIPDIPMTDPTQPEKQQ